MPTTTKSKAKKKKAKQETVVLSVLIDESGSMSGNRQSVVDSYNEFIANMRDADEAKGKDVRTTLAMFDNRPGEPVVRVKHDAIPIGEVREIGLDDYNPHYGTPLNDAVIHTIKAVEAKSPDRALLVIVTDGYENASETSTEDVRQAVEAKEAEGWRFIYMGANVDAFAEGASRGVAAAQSMSYSSTPTGTRAAGQMLSRKGGSYLSSTADLDTDNAETLASMGNVIPDSAPTPEQMEENEKQAKKIAAEQKRAADEARQRTQAKAKESASEASSTALDALKDD